MNKNSTTKTKTPPASQPTQVSDNQLRKVTAGASFVIAQDRFSAFYHS